MRNTARQSADRIHFLRLRHLGLESFLLCRFDRVDDGNLFWCLVAFVNDGIDVETNVTCFITRVPAINRRNVALPILGGG